MLTSNPAMLRRLGWLTGFAALVALALFCASEVPAQDKSDDPKDSGKKVEKKKVETKTTKGGKGKKDEAPVVAVDRTKLTKAQEADITAAIEKRPTDLADTTNGAIDQIDYINKMIEKAWRENKVKPAARCTDYEFVRRIFLDLVGRTPSVAEVKRFISDPPTRRRSMLVDRLLGYNDGKEKSKKEYGPEYGENFANMWTVMLLTRTQSSKTYQDQIRDWLVDQFNGTASQAPDWSKSVTDLLTATGETNKNPAVNYILHHLGEEIKQDHALNGAWDMVPVTSRTTKLFLGIRTQCVQCHDHPFNGEWGQHNFWGINAFFRQVDPTKGRPSMMMAKKTKGVKNFAMQYELTDNNLYNAKGLVPYERRNGVLLYTDPTFLDGKKLLTRGSKDVNRRQELAKLITKSPYFSKAFVNRMWNHFMGKSFTKENVDDFSEANPASHPELLDKLAEDWAKAGHNPKTIIRWICNSRAYGLSAVANEYNDKPEDETLFSRMLLKPMTPEQLFASLMTATQSKVLESREKMLELREEWLTKLVVNFGNDEGEEGSFNGTVVQALLLMNGQDINKAIMDEKDGTVAAILKKDLFSKNNAPQALKDVYMAALSRPPTPKEVTELLNRPDMFQLPRAKGLMTSNPRAFWTGYYQDIFWALLNSNEFILNH